MALSTTEKIVIGVIVLAALTVGWQVLRSWLSGDESGRIGALGKGKLCKSSLDCESAADKCVEGKCVYGGQTPAQARYDSVNCQGQYEACVQVGWSKSICEDQWKKRGCTGTPTAKFNTVTPPAPVFAFPIGGNRRPTVEPTPVP